ncbi:MAG: hypothetical protein EOO11_05315 [Chitinophagaceae bacterium]|nr:MAG: hypothetical protein EOO11_05315 [Chitinophagaceae bacterium]
MESKHSEHLFAEEFEVRHERPTIITIICVLGFVGAGISVLLLFSRAAREIGPWYPPYLGLSMLVGLACMIGIWKMRRWGAYTYTAFVALNQVILLYLGIWTISALLIPGIVVAIVLAHVQKMR